MLEVLELRRSSTKLRQELSYALYKEDAAMRVLARVMRERDDAREALSSIQSSLGVKPSAPISAADNGMEIDGENGVVATEGLTGEADQRVEATAKRYVVRYYFEELAESDGRSGLQFVGKSKEAKASARVCQHR